ncbi:MAG: 2-isopropylmalate synthase, partial [Melioribacter sp.]|nr:2-isopropylmalate synthase [Melioribacter sp.]
PAVIGRERSFALDHMSGIASLRYALNLIGESELDEQTQYDILKEVKSVGQKGRMVDLAELKHIVDAVKHHLTYKR